LKLLKSDVILESGQALPVILHSKRRVGVSPVVVPSLFELLGTGIVMVIGLWNFLLRGSSVTIGLNVALLPRIFLTNSRPIGWAYDARQHWFQYKHMTKSW
jgi:hypothetical protein